ncbi:hypothetical protein Aduo_004005 [Ancylostoma duodenale]
MDGVSRSKEWDCELEKMAEDALNMTCKHTARVNVVQWKFAEVCIKFNKPVQVYGIKGIPDPWWDEGMVLDSKTRKYDEFTMEDFANMANGKNTKIGCSIMKKGQRTRCSFLRLSRKGLSYMKQDWDARLMPTAPRSKAQSVYHQENYLLETHNAFRSSVARGLEPDMLGDFTPKAKEMIKLGYECYVENVVLDTVQCPVEHVSKMFF